MSLFIPFRGMSKLASLIETGRSITDEEKASLARDLRGGSMLHQEYLLVSVVYRIIIIIINYNYI